MLHKLVPGLSFMVADNLPLSSVAALTLTSRDLRSVLQPYLHHIMRIRPATDVKAALLAIYWASLNGDKDLLRHHLCTYPHVEIIIDRTLLHREASNFRTTPIATSDEALDRIIASSGPALTLRTDLVPEYAYQSYCALLYSMTFGAESLFQLALSKTPIFDGALKSCRDARPDMLQAVLEEVRRRGGEEAWEAAEIIALDSRFRKRGVRLLESEPWWLGPRRNGGILHRYLNGTSFRWLSRRLYSVQLIEMVAKGLIDINAVDCKGRTVLHVAVQYDQLKHIRPLLKAGVEVDRRDEDGETVMEMAIRRPWSVEKWVIIEMLQEFGADMELRNRLGVTPAQMLKRRLRSGRGASLCAPL